MSTLVREESGRQRRQKIQRGRIDSLYKVVCDIIQCICGQKCKSLKGHSDSFTGETGKLLVILVCVSHISYITSVVIFQSFSLYLEDALCNSVEVIQTHNFNIDSINEVTIQTNIYFFHS